MTGKLIIDTETCKVYSNEKGLVPYVKLSDVAQWIEMNAFKADDRGLVGALNLAAQVCSGVFWPSKVFVPPVQVDNKPMDAPKTIGFKPRLLSNDDKEIS